MDTVEFNTGGSPAMDWHPIQEWVEIFLIVLWLRSQLTEVLEDSVFMALRILLSFFLGQVVLDVAKNRSPAPFVIQWISRHIPDIDKWRSFIPDTQHSPNQAAVNELLDQFFSNSAFPARYNNHTCYDRLRALTSDKTDHTCHFVG